MENASHAFLDAVRKSMRQIRAAIGAAKIDPHLLTAAEKLQYEGYLRREETNAVILRPNKDRATIKGDRAPDWPQPRPHASDFAGPAFRCLSKSTKLPRRPSALA